jgi:hypothetical protein
LLTVRDSWCTSFANSGFAKARFLPRRKSLAARRHRFNSWCERLQTKIAWFCNVRGNGSPSLHFIAYSGQFGLELCLLSSTDKFGKIRL